MNRGGWIATVNVVATMFLVACRTPATAPTWQYRIRVIDQQPLVLEVTAHVAFPSSQPCRFLLGQDIGASFLSQVEWSAGTIRRDGDQWVTESSSSQGTLKYRVNVEDLGRAVRRVEQGKSSGRSWMLAWNTFLLVPESVPRWQQTRVSIEGGAKVACALLDSSNETIGSAHRLRRGVHLVFGQVERGRVPVVADDGQLLGSVEVALMDGPMQLPHARLLERVTEVFAAAAEFWEGLPVDSILVSFFPIPGRDDVLFGKVLSSPAPTVCVWIGAECRPDQLRDDWMFMHEVLHLGFPMTRRGKWLDEGMSTYFEPLVRARAGWATEQEVWEELVRGMPRGRATLEQRGMLQARGIDGIYWGGALFCLLVDHEIRRRTAGKQGLEDGLRRLFADDLCIDSGVFDLSQVARCLRSAYPDNVWDDLWARYVEGSAPVPLEELWGSLGIRIRGEQVELDADHPLRHALLTGQPLISGNPQKD